MRTTVALLSVVILAGCGGSSSTPTADESASKSKPSATTSEPSATTSKPSASKSPCVKLAPAMLAEIAGGFLYDGVKLTKGAAVKLPKAERRLGINYAVAVAAKGGDGTVKLILGTGSPSKGPIIASDKLARVYFSWGEDTEDGSPMDELRDSLFPLDAAMTAKKCL